MLKNRTRTHTSPITSTRVVLTSFIVDISDVLLNLVVAYLSGSVVMTTQSLQGLADLTASGLTLVGVRRSRRPADHKHPFGYGRELYFWTVLAGLVMFTITSTMSFFLGLQRYLHPSAIDNIYLAYLVLIIGFFTNGYSLHQSLKRLTHHHSPTKILHIFVNSHLIETKAAFILDLTGTLASITGLVALILYKITGNIHFDGFGAMAIAILMAILTYILLINVKDLIIGRSAPRSTENLIIATINNLPQIDQVLDLKTVMIGSEKILVNVEVHAQHNLSTQQLEHLMDLIKSTTKKTVPEIDHIQVELESLNNPNHN